MFLCILFPAEAIEARSPSRAEFFDAFEKCKYSFILLVSLVLWCSQTTKNNVIFVYLKIKKG